MDEILKQNKTSWDNMADTWFGTTALPNYGCYIPGEETLQLFPDLSNTKVLDIGCGSGHSLKWCGDHGASELWGLDLSTKQIEIAQKYLSECGYVPNLFNIPMESDYGLPKKYFDIVYSIYALGWTTDLKSTIANIYSYLKPGGTFIFSWDNPLMRCLDSTDEKLLFTGSYTTDESISFIQRGQPVTIRNYRLSTYINALADAGFLIQHLVEETDPAVLQMEAPFSPRYYSEWKAQKMPLSFVMKAKKIR